MATEHSHVSPPNRLSLSGDTERAWRTFKQKFTLYLKATEKDKKPEAVQVALLLTTGGDDLLEIYNSLEFAPAADSDPDPSQVLSTVLGKLDEYFTPRKNELAARYKFRKCVQNSGESLESYITRLKILIKDCDYDKERDKSLRDQIVFGCSDDELRKKFFEAESLDLKKTVDICVNFQASKKQMNVYKEGNVDTVQNVSHRQSRSKQHKSHVNAPVGSGTNKKDKVSCDSKSVKTKMRNCKFCNQKHVWAKNKCPAFGKVCSSCSKLNHFSVMCPNLSSASSKVNEVGTVRNNVSDSDDSSVEYVLKVNNKPVPDKLVSADMEIDGNRVKFQVDSGASINVIPVKYVPHHKLCKSDTLLEAWSSSTVKPLGKCRIVIRNCKNNKKYSVEFVVVKEEYTPLLGKRTSEQMGLITVNYENICVVNDVFSEYSDVFSDDLGTLPGNVHLTIDETVQPVAITSCRLPISQKGKVKEILENMEKKNIVSKVDQPTDWVSRMVTATKSNGDIRVCIDPQVLNKALKREFHPIPVVDDVLPELSKAKVFFQF